MEKIVVQEVTSSEVGISINYSVCHAQTALWS